jgi:hypothetical protein
MRNRFLRGALMGLLALGTIGGFGAGFASLGHRSCHRRAEFERHVARICAEAAIDARNEEAGERPPRHECDHREHWH